jgi:hypothetical protein
LRAISNQAAAMRPLGFAMARRYGELGSPIAKGR